MTYDPNKNLKQPTRKGQSKLKKLGLFAATIATTAVVTKAVTSKATQDKKEEHGK